MSTTPLLGCRGLVKSFGGHRVLDGLDLTVVPGRLYALLGRNGAGKSTSLKILLGLLDPDAGERYLNAAPFTRAALAHVGASIDGPALYGHLSARDNLRIHAALTGVSAERVTEVLDLVGLGADDRNTARTKVRAFSTGMKARLALAIALLTDPEILVLDEPQNGLDPEGIIELRGLIRDLAARGRTVLISSHQLGEVVRLADDIGVLAGGRLVYEGPLAEFAAEGDLEAAYLAATTEGAR